MLPFFYALILELKKGETLMAEKIIEIKNLTKSYGKHRGVEKESFEAGCGGLYSTVEDYEHFAQMLLNEGFYKENVILKTSLDSKNT